MAQLDPKSLGALVYDELRRRAQRILASSRGRVRIDPTDLVHDVFVKLMGGGTVDWRGRTHFTAVASRQLRHVLVDHIRSARAEKRGGGVRLTTLDGSSAIAPRREPVDLLALEQALAALERKNARRAEIVVLRLFGGLTVEEIARYYEVSDTAIKKHWRVAKAWLAGRLG